MSKALKIEKGLDEAILEFLRSLMQDEKIKGVFTLKKLNDEGAVSYSLITSSDELEKAVPFYPVMPMNAGRALSAFTLERATEEPVAAVLRPCELRAFIELVKRVQGSLDNILLISLSCGGVYPLKSWTKGEVKELESPYWDAVKKAEIAPDIRTTCQICEKFIPHLADISVAAVGEKDLDKECTILLNTQKGENFAGKAPGSSTTKEIETELTNKLKESRSEKKKALFEHMDEEESGLQALVKAFSACLGCHACSHACPICFCSLCDFESKSCEYYPENFNSALRQKGGLKVPPGNIFFHIGRMNHMAFSCVQCGMCSDVCPVYIPVANYFVKTGEALQEVFKYIPGEDVEEPVPSGTFKAEEFKEVGEESHFA
jgi:formate dehydrogenase subunit beta